MFLAALEERDTIAKTLRCLMNSGEDPATGAARRNETRGSERETYVFNPPESSQRMKLDLHTTAERDGAAVYHTKLKECRVRGPYKDHATLIKTSP